MARSSKLFVRERSLRSGSLMRVLVPGAGLGRLVFDLCCAGFDTEGNEISYHQLLASSYVLNMCPEAKEHTLFPWVALVSQITKIGPTISSQF